MTISANLVKELREKTNAGMMDCKKALAETNGDFEKAVEWLRIKGLSSAAKKAGRVATEGTIVSYLHGGGRIGVLVEVNSETDFVARNENFQEFAKDVALHVAALNPRYVSMDEIPEEARLKEKEILMAKARESGKPENMLEKITEGQLKKWAADICLLEQGFVKNPDMKMGDYLKEMIAKIGENLVVRRFVRFELGEGLEKKQNNFAEEVAAQLKG